MSYLITPIRRQARFLPREARLRSGFRFGLVLDAMLSVVLVLGLFHVATAASRRDSADQLKISGAVAFTGDQLVAFIKKENFVAYWAGPNSADKFTVVATIPGEVTIAYFPKNADIGKLSTSLLVVQTHSHFSADADAVESFAQDASGAGSFLLNQGQDGNVIHYNPATPTRVTITYKNRFDAVTIFNPTPEASLALAMKYGAISKIS